nr:MAG TPA: hypothetical protein [Caudoviricetes sp.]
MIRKGSLKDMSDYLFVEGSGSERIIYSTFIRMKTSYRVRRLIRILS